MDTFTHGACLHMCVKILLSWAFILLIFCIGSRVEYESAVDVFAIHTYIARSQVVGWRGGENWEGRTQGKQCSASGLGTEMDYGGPVGTLSLHWELSGQTRQQETEARSVAWCSLDSSSISQPLVLPSLYPQL